MISQPSRRMSPNRRMPAGVPCADGGTLARLSTRAGHLSHPSRVLRRASCSVRLSREARSVHGRGWVDAPVNRAICMKGRGGSCRSPRPLSSILGEASDQLRTHHANRYQAAAVPQVMAWKMGAPVSVMRLPARPFRFAEVDDLRHRGGSFHSLPCIGEPMRRAFQNVGRVFQNGRAC